MKKFLQITLAFAALILVGLTANAWKPAMTTEVGGNDYKFEYNTQNDKLSLTWAEGTDVAETGKGGVSLEGYNGNFQLAPMNSTGDFFATNNDQLVAYVSLADGEYTLKIQAGTYTINGKENEAISETFTVAKNPTFDGEKWNEKFFTQSMWQGKDVPSPIVIETEGAKMTTEDHIIKQEDFYGNVTETAVKVMYNLYEDGELDWTKGTKLIFEAKDNISRIIFEASSGSNLDHGSADKGSYLSGEWNGALMKGEKLTFIADEGMYIKNIIICYNGDEAQGGSQVETKGTITVEWPTANMPLEKIEDGGLLAEFTTTKDYAYITVELVNLNDSYHNLYDLPVRYMDDVKAGKVVCRTSTPGDAPAGQNPAWYTFNGDAYNLIVKGYVNHWDQMDEYDAIAVIPVVGTGIEHDKMSTLNLIKITPETATELNYDAPKAKLTSTRDNIVTVEFDGEVSMVDALRPGSVMAGTNELHLKTEPVADTNGKLWSITVPKEELTDEVEYAFFLTAKDKDGGWLNLNENRSDHALAIIFSVTDEEIDPSDVTTLGRPAFSIADGEEDVDPATEVIKMTFPEAKGYDGKVIAKVSGVLACKDMSTPAYFETDGTIGEGVDINVKLRPNKGWMLMINSISLYNEDTQYDEINKEYTTFLSPIGTYNTNYTVNFTTKKEEGEEQEGIKVVVSKIEEQRAYVKIEGISSVLSTVTADSYVHIANVEINGEPSAYYPDDTFGADVLGDICVTAPVLPGIDSEIKEGINTMVIKAEALEIGEFPMSAWNPTIMYTNMSDIKITFNVLDGTLGINDIMLDNANNDKMFNIAGQQINSNVKGIIIKNGKKFISK